MRRATLLCLLAACGGDDAPTPPITGDATAHVQHYDYRLDLASRAAHATVTLALDTPGNCVALPFRAGSFTAATALADGAPATEATLAGGSLKLCAATGHPAGDTMTIEADQTVDLATLSTSQVGFSITKDSDGNAFTYLVSWVGGCDKFGPCDSRPDQFATYTFHVTHDPALMVRCSGAITETSPTETQCDFAHPGGPTYSTFGLAAYPAVAWPITDKGMWGSVHVTVYDRPSTGTAAAINATYHGGFISWMESTFGPFPFGSELRVLTAPTYWSGFEHPGNIVLDDTLAHIRFPQYSNTVAHTLDHEMAHQWAGDQTTIADTYDFVWKESMAEYLAFVHEDMTDGAVALRTASVWKGLSAQSKYFPVPGEHPALFDYYGDVYGAGPMTLFRQLEVLSSRDQVIAALKSVLGAPRALSVAALLAALTTSTGLDLTQYAADWIKGTGAPKWPRIKTTYTAGTGGTSTLLVQQTSGKGGCKFHVGLDGANPGEEQLVEVDTYHHAGAQTLTVPTPAFAVATVVLDPRHECLVFPDGALAARAPGRPWLSARGDALSR